MGTWSGWQLRLPLARACSGGAVGADSGAAQSAAQGAARSAPCGAPSRVPRGAPHRAPRRAPRSVCGEGAELHRGRWGAGSAPCHWLLFSSPMSLACDRQAQRQIPQCRIAQMACCSHCRKQIGMHAGNMHINRARTNRTLRFVGLGLKCPALVLVTVLGTALRRLILSCLRCCRRLGPCGCGMATPCHRRGGGLQLALRVAREREQRASRIRAAARRRHMQAATRAAPALKVCLTKRSV